MRRVEERCGLVVGRYDIAIVAEGRKSVLLRSGVVG
jgi:hypothetical protein